MEIRVEQGDIAASDADALVVNLFEGVTSPGGGTGAVDAALGGAISTLIAQGDIRGKARENTLLYSLGKLPAPRVLVVGLGKSRSFNLDGVRDAAAGAVRYLRRPGIRRVATIVHGAGIGGLDPEDCAQAVAEGSVLGAYRFTRHKARKDEDDENNGLDRLTIVEYDRARLETLRRGVQRGVVVAEATNFARDLANEPSNHLYPSDLASRAQEMAAASGIECTILERADMEAKGMGSLLSVARGSEQPPKLVQLAYRGRAGKGFDLALVGKGITFDSGGISIKQAAGMDAMKADMTGAACVIAAIGAVARLRAAVTLLAIAPCTENMPGGSATKPGDVVTAMNGRTIEILNPDAEGRLVLADGLCLARELGAACIVDVATLTGAVTTALGDVCYGLMTNNDEFACQLEAAAARAGEKTWRLPMFKEYDEYIKSDVADIKNVGTRGAGAVVGAKFLENFVEDTPWIHLDIAGVDLSDKDKGWVSKGATGYSVRTLINLALSLAKGTKRTAARRSTK